MDIIESEYKKNKRYYKEFVDKEIHGFSTHIVVHTEYGGYTQNEMKVEIGDDYITLWMDNDFLIFGKDDFDFIINYLSKHK